VLPSNVKVAGIFRQNRAQLNDMLACMTVQHEFAQFGCPLFRNAIVLFDRQQEVCWFKFYVRAYAIVPQVNLSLDALASGLSQPKKRTKAVRPEGAEALVRRC
jgi:hypothetical protein